MNALEKFSLSSGEGEYYKTGKGKPIILLHGFAETYKIWDNISPAISEHYTIIIPSIPGCGNSFILKNEFSMNTIAQFVQQILVQEKIEKTILFGHSMGGYAAVAFAKKHPEKLLALSLVHSSALGDDEHKKKIREQAIAFINKNGASKFIQTLIPKLYGTKKAFNLNKKKHFSMVKKYSDKQIIDCYTAIMHRDNNEAILKELNFPIQFILGDQDQSIDYKKGIGQAACCKMAELTIFRGLGHTSMLENASLLQECIIRFSYDVHHHL